MSNTGVGVSVELWYKGDVGGQATSVLTCIVGDCQLPHCWGWVARGPCGISDP